MGIGIEVEIGWNGIIGLDDSEGIDRLSKIRVRGRGRDKKGVVLSYAQDHACGFARVSCRQSSGYRGNGFPSRIRRSNIRARANAMLCCAVLCCRTYRRDIYI